MSYIIGDTTKTVFVHIPKTAGNAIWKTANTMYPVEIIKNSRCNRNYHSTLLDYENNYFDSMHNPFVFTFVRNPWDRVCSWFFFRKGILEKELQKHSNTGVLPAKKVVNDVGKIKKEYSTMCNSFDRWLYEYHDQPWDYTWFKLSHTQSYWLQSNNVKIQKIIKTEEIDNGLKEVPLFSKINLPKTNKSKKSVSSYKDLYTTKSKKFVGKLYQEDTDNFKYVF